MATSAHRPSRLSPCMPTSQRSVDTAVTEAPPAIVRTGLRPPRAPVVTIILVASLLSATAPQTLHKHAGDRRYGEGVAA